MEYSTEALSEAVAKEKTLLEFICTVESVMRSLKNISKFPQSPKFFKFSKNTFCRNSCSVIFSIF